MLVYQQDGRPQHPESLYHYETDLLSADYLVLSVLENTGYHYAVVVDPLDCSPVQ